jgi:TolA-binding protein
VRKQARSTKKRLRPAKKGALVRKKLSPKGKKKPSQPATTKKRVKKRPPKPVKRTAKPKPPKLTKRKPIRAKAPTGRRPTKGRAIRPSGGKLKPQTIEKAKLHQKAKPAFPSLPVRIFGEAVNLFNHHNFEKAREAFEKFVERFPNESEMVARARTYLAICDQRLARPPGTPRNAEALYNQGVFELNRGQIEQAVRYFEKALKAEPEADHVLYSLAAAHARLGQIALALEELKQAVAKREVYRIQARRDPDFSALYSHPAFQDLVGWEIIQPS